MPIEVILERKDGTEFYTEIVGRIIKINDQDFVLGTVRDITERKRSEEALILSEERFRKMFNGHSAVQLIIDPEAGNIIDANEAASVFYGWTIKELKQMRIQQINELSPEEVNIQMAKAASSQSVRFEFRHRRADNSVRDVEVFSNKVNVSGKAFLYSIIHDISERKQAEAALRESETRLLRAEDFAQFGHWQFSLGNKIMQASDGALKVYGFEHNDIPLSDIKDCALQEFRPRLDIALRDLIEKNTSYDVEFKIKRASDNKIVDVHSKAEYDAVNKIVFGVVQDITERKRIETERENLILELQSAIEHIKTLKGIVPICANCKKVRDDQGYWEQVESYISRNSDARFSHGVCPDCIEKLYPRHAEKMRNKPKE
jgi:PAS domain S-box-containing protein